MMFANEESPYAAKRWVALRPDMSVTELIDDRLSFAENSSNWYRRKKRVKQRLSIASRWIAVTCAIVGGLIPLLATILPTVEPKVGYPILAAGAGFALLDKLFGWSRDWARFMMSATQIEAKSELFRCQCAKMTCMEPSDNAELFLVIEKFTTDISEIVLLETGKWDQELVIAVTELGNLSKDRK